MPTDTSRTKSIIIDTPHDGPHRVIIARETIRTYENGDAMPVGESRRLSLLMDELLAQELPAGPVTIATYADLTALVASCVERVEADALVARAAAEAEARVKEEAERAARQAKEQEKKQPPQRLDPS